MRRLSSKTKGMLLVFGGSTLTTNLGTILNGSIGLYYDSDKKEILSAVGVNGDALWVVGTDGSLAVKAYTAAGNSTRSIVGIEKNR